MPFPFLLGYPNNLYKIKSGQDGNFYGRNEEIRSNMVYNHIKLMERLNEQDGLFLEYSWFTKNGVMHGTREQYETFLNNNAISTLESIIQGQKE